MTPEHHQAAVDAVPPGVGLTPEDRAGLRLLARLLVRAYLADGTAEPDASPEKEPSSGPAPVR